MLFPCCIFVKVGNSLHVQSRFVDTIAWNSGTLYPRSVQLSLRTNLCKANCVKQDRIGCDYLESVAYATVVQAQFPALEVAFVGHGTTEGGRQDHESESDCRMHFEVRTSIQLMTFN